ncbi:hypothetical protein RclHR1_13280004 [Rhizophagus clarus]|uniref:Protein kinase domain-containing protein n=1 Tax=Rhizophagus clarus TaxID=94130 RepID=A0A2Z6QE52_9GLOM|nr:hypothetical protein RclHR1_13280004 [Rhizophagus clarus]
MNDQNSTFDNEMRLRRYGRCYDCKQPKTGGSLWHYWCQTYYSKYFRDDFNSWTSGNELIDKFIQKKQLDALKYHDVIEWIPFDSLKDVGPLNDDEQSEPFFKATWIDGHIEKWKILNGSRINLNFLKLKSMIEASMYYEVVEWIPFDRFNDLQVFEGESGNTLIATWIDGPIRNWNYENNKWERFLADELFCLRSIGENISDFSEIIALNGFDVIRWFFFDRFKDIELIEGEFGTALNAHVPDWNFIPGDLDNIFDDGGNGNDNESVDEKEWAEMTEDWVTETHLLNVNLKRFNSSNISNEFLQEIGQGGFGTAFKTTWIDGYIYRWDYKENKWVRFNSIEDCLKRLDNSHTISQEFLQEVNTQLNAQRYEGSLREMLNKYNYKLSWWDRLQNLNFIAYALAGIYEANLVHKDLHSGNIVMSMRRRSDQKSGIKPWIRSRILSRIKYGFIHFTPDLPYFILDLSIFHPGSDHPGFDPYLSRI